MPHWSYERDTAVGRVRLLIPDTDPQHPLFDDSEIEELIDLCDGNVWRAAAEALEIAATDISRRQRLRVGEMDARGPDFQAAIEQRVRRLRERADRADIDDASLAFVDIRDREVFV